MRSLDGHTEPDHKKMLSRAPGVNKDIDQTGVVVITATEVYTNDHIHQYISNRIDIQYIDITHSQFKGFVYGGFSE